MSNDPGMYTSRRDALVHLGTLLIGVLVMWALMILWAVL